MTDSKVSVPLVALAIVLVVGGTLVGTAFFSTSGGKELAQNETSAIRSLRMIAAAEKAFREEDLDGNDEKDYWIADLAGLAATKKEVKGKAVPLLPLVLLRADPRPIAKPAKPPAPFHGYFFGAIREEDPDEDDPRTDPARFAFCAWPAAPGKSGRATFLIDERGTVHSCDTGGKPPAVWPPQAEPVTRLVDE